MGLLDDAIRQHLDLKRRHGADPSDVAKLEQEAFGPIERGEALEVPRPDPAAEASHAVAHEEEASYEESELEAEETWGAGLPVPEAAPEPRFEPAAELPPEPPTRAAEPPADPPAEPLRPGGSVRLDDVGERTVEFSALSHEPDRQPDAEPGEHDELEETPEFLQETPEHDRLWFEQKPPRDFDF